MTEPLLFGVMLTDYHNFIIRMNKVITRDGDKKAGQLFFRFAYEWSFIGLYRLVLRGEPCLYNVDIVSGLCLSECKLNGVQRQPGIAYPEGRKLKFFMKYLHSIIGSRWPGFV